jgi:hypothetical protein
VPRSRRGRLERYRVVAALKESAGQRRETARLRLQCLAGEKPALSCDHFIAIAVRPHEKRLDDAEAVDAGDKLAKILIGAALPHIHRRDFELGQFDMLKFHGFVLHVIGCGIAPEKTRARVPGSLHCN